MSESVDFTHGARQDIRDVFEWYAERDLELARDLIAEVDRAITRIADHPAFFPRRFGKFRRALLDRFPYALFFQESHDPILVVAVVHHARDPVTIAKLINRPI